MQLLQNHDLLVFVVQLLQCCTRACKQPGTGQATGKGFTCRRGCVFLDAFESSMPVAYALRPSQARVLAGSVWCGASANCSTSAHCSLGLTGSGLRHGGGWFALRSQRDHIYQALDVGVNRLTSAFIPNREVICPCGAGRYAKRSPTKLPMFWGQMVCHGLPIAISRRSEVPRSARLCPHCHDGSVRDKLRMVFECAFVQPLLNNMQTFFQTTSKQCVSFSIRQTLAAYWALFGPV